MQRPGGSEENLRILSSLSSRPDSIHFLSPASSLKFESPEVRVAETKPRARPQPQGAALLRAPAALLRLCFSPSADAVDQQVRELERNKERLPGAAARERREGRTHRLVAGVARSRCAGAPGWRAPIRWPLQSGWSCPHPAGLECTFPSVAVSCYGLLP